MTCHVVVEGELDRRLIERLLRPAYDPKQVRVIAAGGASRVTSVARTILATRREPVVVMVDADAVNERGVVEKRALIEESLGQFAPPTLFRVLLFVPEMEAVLFKDQALVMELTAGRPLAAEEAVRARYEPKDVLSRVFREQGRDPPGGIRDAVERLDLAAARELPVVKQLEEFLRQRLEQAA
jgi:hypothetical protein